MILYVPLKKEWIWTDRICKYLDDSGHNYRVFEPESGKIGLVMNIARLLFFMTTTKQKNLTLIASFASTNGYLLSFVPFLKYTLLVHGSDLLLTDPRVIKRSRRAIKHANVCYVSSAKDFLSKKFEFLDLSEQRYEWGLSKSDLKDIQKFNKDRSGNTHGVSVAGIRHIRRHYCLDETIRAFRLLRDEFNGLKISHFAGVFDQESLEQYSEKSADLNINIINNLPRDRFLQELSDIDIGISITKSDLFGGPILELIAMGAYIVVDDVHPIIEAQLTYGFDNIIRISDLSAAICDLDFSEIAVTRRIEKSSLFIQSIIFENSMKEILNENL